MRCHLANPILVLALVAAPIAAQTDVNRSLDALLQDEAFLEFTMEALALSELHPDIGLIQSMLEDGEVDDDESDKVYLALGFRSAGDYAEYAERMTAYAAELESRHGVSKWEREEVEVILQRRSEWPDQLIAELDTQAGADDQAEHDTGADAAVEQACVEEYGSLTGCLATASVLASIGYSACLGLLLPGPVASCVAAVALAHALAINQCSEKRDEQVAACIEEKEGLRELEEERLRPDR